MAAMPREELSTVAVVGETRAVPERCLHQQEPGVWCLAPERHKRLNAHAWNTCASNTYASAQDWFSSPARADLCISMLLASGRRGRKAGAGDGPGGSQLLSGGSPHREGLTHMRTEFRPFPTLCLSGFCERRCFWSLTNGRQVLAAQMSSNL